MTPASHIQFNVADYDLAVEVVASRVSLGDYSVDHRPVSLDQPGCVLRAGMRAPQRVQRGFRDADLYRLAGDRLDEALVSELHDWERIGAGCWLQLGGVR